MKVYGLDVLLLCIILKKSIALHVFIIDIPDDDLNDLNESEYIYYDYEQSLAPNIVKNKPLPFNAIGLARPKQKEKNDICDRFGSMYGIDAKKHKCEHLRLNDEKRRYKRYKPFLLNPLDLQAREKRNRLTDPRAEQFLDLTRDDFSLDYVDDYWRSRPDNAPKCTLKDYITNKCNFRKFQSHKQRYEASDLSSSESSDDEDVDVPKRKKPKRFQVISHQNKHANKFNDKINRFNKKKLAPKNQNSDESESSDDESFKKVVQKIKKQKKRLEPYVSDEIPEQPLTDIEEVKQEDPKLSTLESDSFEDNRPKAKFTYLQGHRYVKPNDFRRSRMETFLPKRNTWKQEDIPKLGFFWYEGGPKGIV